jgi:mycothione reductase
LSAIEARPLQDENHVPDETEPIELDLLIIGAGTGNTILTPDFDDWTVGIVERDLFGGTCMNRGCIPTKMLVYTADLAVLARDLGRYGIDAEVHGVRWPDVVDRVFGRIDPIAPAGEAYRDSQPNVTVISGDGRFVDHKIIEVDGTRYRADQIVLAAGARPVVHAVPGLDTVPYETSDTVMRLEALPERLLIIGGSYIASELAHVFDAMGSHVTVISRSERLLRHEDESVSARFTEINRDRFNLIAGADLERVEASDGTVTVHLQVDGEPVAATGDTLLVATGRVPNGDQLGVAETGIELDSHGYVPTDEYFRTDVEGIWALGDITSPEQLKHLANAQGRAIAHNLHHPDDLRPLRARHIPHAVFSHPQVASVGATEQSLRADGRDYITGTQDYGDVAYGWAMEECHGFAKVIADPETRLLLGAHIIGPHSATLIQQLIQGMEFGRTVDEMANGQMYIHPALGELLENALLQL